MRSLSLMALSLAACCLAGCADDYWVEFRYLTDVPPEAHIDSALIQIPEGIAVGVEALAVEDNQRIDREVDFVPERSGIVGIDRGLEDRSFVIYGIAEGSTGIDVYFNDELVMTMPGKVVPPTPAE